MAKKKNLSIKVNEVAGWSIVTINNAKSILEAIT